MHGDSGGGGESSHHEVFGAGQKRRGASEVVAAQKRAELRERVHLLVQDRRIGRAGRGTSEPVGGSTRGRFTQEGLTDAGGEVWVASKAESGRKARDGGLADPSRGSEVGGAQKGNAFEVPEDVQRQCPLRAAERGQFVVQEFGQAVTVMELGVHGAPHLSGLA